MKPYDIVGLIAYPPLIDILFMPVFILAAPSLGLLTPWRAMILSLIFITAIPLFPVPYFMKKGLVDFYVSEREKRTIFYVIAIGSYLIGAALFLTFGAYLLAVAALSFAVIAFAMMVINFWWKISVHAAGVAGPVTAFAYVFTPWLALLHGATLFVMISRVRLGVHTWSQVVAGAALSAALTLGVFFALYPRPF